MNILLLNGSPHGRLGESMALARLVTDRLPGDTVCLDLYEMVVAPCRDCGACADGGRCPLDAADAMEEVTKGLSWSDVVLMASPLHFTSLSGPLVCCIGRMQRFWNSGGLNGKPRSGGLVVTGGTLYRDMFEPARRVGAAAFATLGIAWRGMAAVGNTDCVRVADNPAAQVQAAALAEALLRDRQPELFLNACR